MPPEIPSFKGNVKCNTTAKQYNLFSEMPSASFMQKKEESCESNQAEGKIIYFHSGIEYCSSTMCSFINDKSLIDWHLTPFYKNTLKVICSRSFNFGLFPWTRRYTRAEITSNFCLRITKA